MVKCNKDQVTRLQRALKRDQEVAVICRRKYFCLSAWHDEKLSYA
jgi:hypothetical protein